MRSILVPVADRPECRVALSTAFDLAARLKSDVVGCHFQAAPIDPENWDLADLWTMNQRRAWPISDAAHAEQNAQAAKRLFVSVAGERGYPLSDAPGTAARPSARWDVLTGSPPDLMPAVGGASDMVVVSRVPARGGEKAWLVLTSALLDSLRPVLVLPQRPTSVTGKRIAIAWNRGRTETLALHAALPLVKAADDVVLITAGEGGKGRGPTSDDILRYLAAHGVAARAKRLARTEEGRALVETAAADGADLLLAGAYTRGRLREMVFGGVTEYLITKTEFPVLMMHA